MPEKAAERQKAERRAKAFCHRAAVNGVAEGGPLVTGRERKIKKRFQYK